MKELKYKFLRHLRRIFIEQIDKIFGEELDEKAILNKAAEDALTELHNEWLESEFCRTPHLTTADGQLSMTVYSNWHDVPDISCSLKAALEYHIKESIINPDLEYSSKEQITMLTYMASDFRELSDICAKYRQKIKGEN